MGNKAGESGGIYTEYTEALSTQADLSVKVGQGRCTRWEKQWRVEAMQGGHEKRTGNPKIQTVLKQTGGLKDESKTSLNNIVAFLLLCEPQECYSSWCWAQRKDGDPGCATSL